MKNKKFYDIGSGWATKYFWFDIVEKIDPSNPPKESFDEMIKAKKITFTKQSGTTPADIHNSTLAINFYSQKFVDFLSKNNIPFLKYKIKFFPALQNIGNYYYLEFKDKLLAQKTMRHGLVDKVTFHLKDWKGQQLFVIKDTMFIVITFSLKSLMEKENFKNILYGEIIPAKK